MTISHDNFSLYIAAAGTAVSFICWTVLAVRDRWPALRRVASCAFGVSVLSLLYASVYLLKALISAKRYDIAYIHDYSGPSDALIYRISSFWAGQQGSMLLWALLVGVIGLLLVRKLQPALAAFWASVLGFMTVLLLIADPFAKLAEFVPGTIGVGLNPLLKNPWMAIHPPVVFLGYAALMVPAAFAANALIRRDGSNWHKDCLPWTLFGWVSLTAGLVLGMIWSYEVLGWGGYWGWDPVENASLVPWLTGTALLHGLIVQRYRGRMAKPNVFLALVTFMLIVLATFLTRSGVLSESSVHSFSDLGVYGYLLGFLIFYTAVCIALLVLGLRKIDGAASALHARSRDFAIGAGAVALTLFAAAVLAGTMNPVFTKGGLEPSFYNRMAIPVVAAIVLLLAFAQYLPWSRKGDTKPDKRLSVLGIVFAGVLLVGLAIGPSGARVPAGLVALSVVCLAVVVLSVFKSRLLRAGGHLAHVGVALMVVGVVVSAAGSSKNLVLPKNGPAGSAIGYQFRYLGSDMTGPNSEVVKLAAQRPGQKLRVRMPVDYTEHGAVRAPFIKSSIAGDLYVSPTEVRSLVLTPTAAVTDQGWVPQPVQIPGSSARLVLDGMQVEQKAAKLQYSVSGGKPHDLWIAEGMPASIDGYRFEFKRFIAHSAKDTRTMIAGVDVVVSGNDLPESAVVAVSYKPFIWVLWLGTVLMMVGGAIALFRRHRENIGGKNGILPDSD